MFKYNPFKWHVVRLPNGRYAVRKLLWYFPVFYFYADADFDGYMWSCRSAVRDWAVVEDLPTAVRLVRFMNNKTKVVWTE